MLTQITHSKLWKFLTNCQWQIFMQLSRSRSVQTKTRVVPRPSSLLINDQLVVAKGLSPIPVPSSPRISWSSTVNNHLLECWDWGALSNIEGGSVNYCKGRKCHGLLCPADAKAVSRLKGIPVITSCPPKQLDICSPDLQRHIVINLKAHLLQEMLTSLQAGVARHQ